MNMDLPRWERGRPVRKGKNRGICHYGIMNP
jgi:hypothetical protein